MSEPGTKTEARYEVLAKLASEAMWWMERANEPDDENQTKEQYRLMILDLLRATLSTQNVSEISSEIQ